MPILFARNLASFLLIVSLDISGTFYNAYVICDCWKRRDLTLFTEIY